MRGKRAPGPTGYQWSFVALEYYALILNRSYKIFVTDDLVCGAIVRGLLASSPIVPASWYDPDSFPRERILRRYNGVDVSSAVFARKNYWNFQLPRSELADVEFTSAPKWGMGKVPYSGRIILYYLAGGSRELILLGAQDGPSIRDRLRPQVVAARLPWWHRWLPDRRPSTAPELQS